MQVLGSTRAATSSDSDLDSWVADFGMTRFAAVAASGVVTFSRTTPGFATTIAPGALVRTGLGVTDQIFTVVSDLTNPAWAGSGYLVNAADTMITVRVIAQQAGTAGNVVAGSVSTMGTAIPGIDSVTNQYAMTGGIDAESDAALRVRFAGFLDSRNRATNQAVGFAVASVRQGISYTIADRTDASGSIRPGHFTVTIDDGSGSPSSSFLEQVAAAVDLVRPIGATFSIRPPLIISIDIRLQVSGSPIAVQNVRNAVMSFVGMLPIGAGLAVTRLYQLAYSADPSVKNVSDALINGVDADYTPPVFGLLRPSTVTVTS